MPNNIQNEIVFENVGWLTRRNILKKIVKNGRVDFEILVPSPPNLWRWNEGKIHEETFKNLFMDWARQNWGTKWNAYGSEVVQARRKLIIRFKTAWRPPYGWIIALHNCFKIPFTLLWLDEGSDDAYFEKYILPQDCSNDIWSKEKATEKQKRHIHKLLWGVEEFKDEETE